MTLAITINVILAATVFAIVVGMILRTILSTAAQPHARVARVRAPRERTAPRGAYRSVTGQP